MFGVGLLLFFAAPLGVEAPPPEPDAQLACAGGRVDWPSLGQDVRTIAVLFPVETCHGIRPGEAGILEWHHGRWWRLAIIGYDRGSNSNDRAFGRHAYRFANDRDLPADMWIDEGVLVIMRGQEALLRHKLSR